MPAKVYVIVVDPAVLPVTPCITPCGYIIELLPSVSSIYWVLFITSTLPPPDPGPPLPDGISVKSSMLKVIVWSAVPKLLLFQAVPAIVSFLLVPLLSIVATVVPSIIDAPVLADSL